MSHIHDVIATVQRRNAGEPEFHQAVQEVLESLTPVLRAGGELYSGGEYRRLCESGGGDVGARGDLRAAGE
jgi:glutamate dehydrogenase (NADP+)